jgi:hypothetical protein
MQKLQNKLNYISQIKLSMMLGSGIQDQEAAGKAEFPFLMQANMNQERSTQGRKKSKTRS